jgi:hypothetical protein
MGGQREADAARALAQAAPRPGPEVGLPMCDSSPLLTRNIPVWVAKRGPRALGEGANSVRQAMGPVRIRPGASCA